VAVQDAAAVGLVLAAARQQGVGREVDLQYVVAMVHRREVWPLYAGQRRAGAGGVTMGW
jgi:hypothetical protein